MLLPYVSDRPPAKPPVAVVALVLVNFLAFGLIVICLQFTKVDVVALYVNLSLVPTAIRWYSPLTYCFLHGDAVHLSANMLFLWVFGGGVEDAVGWKRFLVLYLGAAVVTGLLQAIMERLAYGYGAYSQIVGASGAVSALVGVFAVRFYRSRIKLIGLPFSIHAVVLLAIALGTEMAEAAWQFMHQQTETTAAAHWAHISGFVLGIVVAQALRLGRAGKHEYLESDAVLETEHGSPLTAVRRWEKVLHSKPGDLAALAELGKAWATIGDREQAADAYRKSITGYLKAGNKLEAAGRYLEMEDQAIHARFDPSDLLTIAGSLEEGSRHREALAALEILRTTFPSSREAEMGDLRTGVILLRKLKKPEEASKRMTQFLETYPNSDWRAYVQELLRSIPRDSPETPVDNPPSDRDTNTD